MAVIRHGSAAGTDGFTTIKVAGQSDIVADSTSDDLTFVNGSNITITTDAGTDSVTIAASGGGGGGGGDSFKTISVSGQDDVVASGDDTLTLAAGSNITITTVAGSDTITVASADTQLTQEQVEDFVDGVIVGGTNVTSTYDDAAGTLTLSSTDTNTQTESFKTISVSGQDNVVADSSTDTLTLAAGANVTITTTAGSDTVTIASADTNTQTESFKTISVSGQDDVVADGSTDTLTLAAGSNITLTTTAASDTITIAATGGGGGGGWTDDGSTVRLTTAGDDVGVGTATANEKLTVDGALALKSQASSPSGTADYAKLFSKMASDENVQLLLHGQGVDGATTITDSSAGGRSHSANSNVELDTEEKTLSQASSILFNGSSSYLTYADASWQNVDADSAFVIHMWVRFNGAPSSAVFVGGTTSGGYRLLYYEPSDTWQFGYGSNYAGDYVVTDTGVPTSTWFHLAFVRQTDGTMRIFRDGIQQGSDADPPSAIALDPAGLFIGRNYSSTMYFNGWLQEFTLIMGSDNGWSGTSFTKPTAPATGLAEMWAADEAGNETKLSSHTPDGTWEYLSQNKKTGKTVRINMEDVVKDLGALTGKDYIKNR